MELARLQSAAMFAPEAPSDDEADVAWEQVDTIRRAAMRRTRGDDGSTRAGAGAVRSRSGVGRSRIRSPESRQPVDERGALGVEGAHVGVDVGGEPVDGDEQRELAGAQRVEDLAVVVARPHARGRR